LLQDSSKILNKNIFINNLYHSSQPIQNELSTKSTKKAREYRPALRDDLIGKNKSVADVERAMRTNSFGQASRKIAFVYTGRLDSSSLVDRNRFFCFPPIFLVKIPIFSVITLGDTSNRDAFVGNSLGVL
jgi:hypothetical protein